MPTPNQVRKAFQKRLEKAGEYFIVKQPADLGNHSGVVKVPDTESMVYARLVNGQVIEVFNDIAPNIYNWKVYIGRDKSQPTFTKVLESRWVYNIAQTVAYVLFHHRQHEYPNPDTVWIMRDQFMPLLVLPAGGFTVKLFGDTVYQPSMLYPIRVLDTVLDMSAYVNLTTANYVLLELATSGAINYVVGDSYTDIVALRLAAPIPTPTQGNFPICAIEFYAGQTEIRRDSTERNIIDLRMFTSEVHPTAGTQINIAAADTPLDADLFGFWDVVDSALKQISFAGLKALITALFNTHFEPLTANVPREFDAWIIDGALAVTTDAAPAIWATRPMKLAACYIFGDDPGSAGSTIVDINLNGTTIFTTSGNRPELAWDDSDGWALSGDPEVIDVAIGDKLSVDIDQIATGASRFRIALMEMVNELVYDLDNKLVVIEVEN